MTHTHRVASVAMALILGPWWTPAHGQDAGRVRGMVPPDWPDRLAAPIAVPIPAGLPGEVMSVELSPGDDGKSSNPPAQIEPAGSTDAKARRLWLLWPGRVKAPGTEIELRLSPGERAASGEASTLTPYRSRREGEQLHVTSAEGRPVLSYWHGKPKPGQRHPLTSFVHPVVGLDGEVLTALSPSDHLHHRGVFWTWVRHEHNGKSLGSWWIPDTIHLEQRELEFKDGPIFSWFRAAHDWVYQPRESREGLAFIREQVVCRVFQTTSEGRAIDFDLTLTALLDGVRIGGTTEKDKGYGGFTFRYGPAADAQIVADGKDIPRDLNHLRALWADWTGRFELADGKPAKGPSGVALFVGPGHPDSPPEWITRLYGVLNVSYPGLGMIDLPKERPLRLSYRIWIHRGRTAEARVEDQFRAYRADWKWTHP